MTSYNDADYELGPFHDLLGIEVEDVGEGRSILSLELTEMHSSSTESLVAQGGVVFTLADVAGALAVISVNQHVTPTIDIRIDYLAPATSNLRAEATVLRNGGTVGIADVEVIQTDDECIAVARGMYKTAGYGPDAPWHDIE